MNPRDNTLPDLVFTTEDSERCRKSIKSKGFATVESFDNWEPLAVRTWFLREGGIDWVREALLTEDIRGGGTEDERISSERMLARECRDIADGVHCAESETFREGVHTTIRLNKVKQPIRSRARYYWRHKQGTGDRASAVGLRNMYSGLAVNYRSRWQVAGRLEFTTTGKISHVTFESPHQKSCQ